MTAGDAINKRLILVLIARGERDVTDTKFLTELCEIISTRQLSNPFDIVLDSHRVPRCDIPVIFSLLVAGYDPNDCKERHFESTYKNNIYGAAALVHAGYKITQLDLVDICLYPSMDTIDKLTQNVLKHMSRDAFTRRLWRQTVNMFAIPRFRQYQWQNKLHPQLLEFCITLHSMDWPDLIMLELFFFIAPSAQLVPCFLLQKVIAGVRHFKSHDARAKEEKLYIDEESKRARTTE